MTNLHIPSEALFFKMFLTHYVLLGIFMFLCPDFLFPDYESIVHSTVCFSLDKVVQRHLFLVHVSQCKIWLCTEALFL